MEKWITVNLIVIFLLNKREKVKGAVSLSTPSKRELILQSALRNFVEKGYDRATMQNIAEEAGVGKGTIYEYFSSKEALFIEVILTGMDSIIKQLSEAVQVPGTMYEKVSELYKKNIELLLNEADMRELMLSDIGKVPTELRDKLLDNQNELLVRVEQLFQEAIDKKEIRNVHPRIAASVVLNCLQVIYYYPLEEGETYEDIVEEQLHILFTGLSID